jgi:hypothetical protein
MTFVGELVRPPKRFLTFLSLLRKTITSFPKQNTPKGTLAAQAGLPWVRNPGHYWIYPFLWGRQEPLKHVLRLN